MRIILFLLPLFLIGGCTGNRLLPADPSPSPGDPENISRSLFRHDQQTISEDDIQRLLNGRINLPDTLRIALLNYGSNTISRYYQAYRSSEEYLKLKQSYIDTFLKELSTNGRIARIILMPELLLGPQPNLLTLRETAVRLQADVLFIFSLNSDIYYEYKTFRKDEAKAFATCEALMMDIRTGMIPFSEVISRDAIARKSPADANDTELRKRAEKEAVESVLAAVSRRLNEYLRSAR